jgi:hypothetical protein
VEAMPLFEDAHERVQLERWSPGAAVEVPLPGGMELLVLEGGFAEGGEVFEAHSWLRLPAGVTLRAVAGPQGCRVWVKAGHLANVRAAPAAALSNTVS